MVVDGVVVVAEEAMVAVVFTTEAGLGVVADEDSRGVRTEGTFATSKVAKLTY